MVDKKYSEPIIQYRNAIQLDGNFGEAEVAYPHVLKLNPKFGAAEDVRRALATIG
jgi:hypothetical protein